MHTTEPHLVALVIDDQPSMHEFMIDFHREAGIKVHDAVCLDEAFIIFHAHPDVQAVVSVIEAAGQVDRFELAREIRERWPQVWLVITLGDQNLEPEDQPNKPIFVVKAHLLDIMINVVRQIASPFAAEPSLHLVARL